MIANSPRALLWLGAVAWSTAAALAGAAGLAAAAFIAAWAFVHGDHPWPPAVPWIIGGAAVTGGAGGALIAGLAARARGRATDAMTPAQARSALSRWAAAGTLLLAVVVAGGVAWVRADQDAAGQARLHEQRREALAASMHQPTAVALALGPQTITVEAVLDGARAGRYRWQVRLVPALTSVVLAQAESALALQPGLATHTATFETAAVLAAWRGRLLGGGTGLVEQTLVAEVSLEPELSEPEQQLQAGGLPLRRTARAGARLRFVADAGGVRIVP